MTITWGAWKVPRTVLIEQSTIDVSPTPCRVCYHRMKKRGKKSSTSSIDDIKCIWASAAVAARPRQSRSPH